MLTKRIVASIIDWIISVLPIFWIGIFINTYLYYFKWKTIWLLLFKLHIEQEKDPLSKADLLYRFLFKYWWLLLLIIISSIVWNLITLFFAWIFYDKLGFGEQIALYIFIIRIIFTILFFIFWLYSFIKKKKFWREKYWKINLDNEQIKQ